MHFYRRGFTAGFVGTGGTRRLLFLFFVSGNRLEILGFKDLTAVQTLYIIDAVTPGNYFGTDMVTHTN
jgi:hypothetical protein